MIKLPANKMVSIVIVNWNTKKLLNDCLNSIYQQTDNALIEVIVVDNNSSDNSCAMVKMNYPEVILIQNVQNVGFAAANNQGFEIATGQYILMLNSDTLILDKAIEKVLNYAENNKEVGVIGCKLRYPDMKFQNSCFRFPGMLSVILGATYLSQIFNKSTIFNRDRYGNREWFDENDVNCVMGSFLFVRKKVLEQAGYLDTDYFMYGEEADLCYRIKKLGYKIRFYPDAQIIHIWGGSQKQSEISAWRYEAIRRGILLFISKRKSLAEAYLCSLIMLVFLFPRVFAWALFDAVHGFRRKPNSRPQLPKAKFGLFLIRVLIKPSVLMSKWEGKQ